MDWCKDPNTGEREAGSDQKGGKKQKRKKEKEKGKEKETRYDLSQQHYGSRSLLMNSLGRTQFQHLLRWERLFY